MMLRKVIPIGMAAVACFSAKAQERVWEPDLLPGFEATTVEMPADYAGEVVCTVVRHLVPDSLPCKRVAVVYVHGYNDYFFQSEMGERFAGQGYNFYAVDLRKYGRSWRQGQRHFEVRDIAEYYPDIDAAIAAALADGNTSVALMGHSTGGLTLACYLASGAGEGFPVGALLLNSPFLDMNLSGFNERIAVPVVSWLSRLFPDAEISQGGDNSYAQSILARYHGEWDYRTDWKLEVSPDVTFGWLGAIHRAHKFIQPGADISVPILLMHSDNSVACSGGWSPGLNSGDAVLDVGEISLYGLRLGRNVDELTVAGGMHDLFLSRKPVRESLYSSVFAWLAGVLALQESR